MFFLAFTAQAGFGRVRKHDTPKAQSQLPVLLASTWTRKFTPSNVPLQASTTAVGIQIWCSEGHTFSTWQCALQPLVGTCSFSQQVSLSPGAWRTVPTNDPIWAVAICCHIYIAIQKSCSVSMPVCLALPGTST